jgi:acylphosphatase
MAEYLYMIKHIDISVRGKVQGVFFRVSAKKEADSLNIKGYARNMSDGKVFIEAEGEGESLSKFIDWCKLGPTYAKVTDVTAEEAHEIKNFKGFSMR